VSLKLEPLLDGIQFDFRPAQFVKLQGASGREAHFAIASEPEEKRFVEFLVKHHHGTVAEELCDAKVGDRIKAAGERLDKVSEEYPKIRKKLIERIRVRGAEFAAARDRLQQARGDYLAAVADYITACRDLVGARRASASDTAVAVDRESCLKGVTEITSRFSAIDVHPDLVPAELEGYIEKKRTFYIGLIQKLCRKASDSDGGTEGAREAYLWFLGRCDDMLKEISENVACLHENVKAATPTRLSKN